MSSKAFIVGGLVLVLGSGTVLGACGGSTSNVLSGISIGTVLGADNNSACTAGSGNCPTGGKWAHDSVAGENNNETIVKTSGTCGGVVGSCTGNVYDYKLGPTNGSDPSGLVGTFTISGGFSQGSIQYVYNNGGGSYTYCVRGTASPYTFVDTASSNGGAVGTTRSVTIDTTQ